MQFGADIGFGQRPGGAFPKVERCDHSERFLGFQGVNQLLGGRFRAEIHDRNRDSGRTRVIAKKAEDVAE